MAFTVKIRRSLPFLRLGVPLLFLLLSIALLTDHLPGSAFGSALLLAAALPFCWPRGVGSWPGLLALMVLAWLPVFVIDDASFSLRNAVLLWLMLAALAASPAALGLLLWRRRISAYVALAGYALLPVSMAFLMARVGSALDVSMEDANWLSKLAWLPGMWYPLLGVCMGSLAFVIGLMLLVLREAQGGEGERSEVRREERDQ